MVLRDLFVNRASEQLTDVHVGLGYNRVVLNPIHTADVDATRRNCRVESRRSFDSSRGVYWIRN